MLDWWDDGPNYDDERFNTSRFINSIPETTLEAFRQSVMNMEPMYGTYNYDALERAVVGGITSLELMLMITKVLHKYNNLDALQSEIKDRYAQLRNHRHPRSLHFFNLNTATLFTITNYMNVVISQFSPSGAGRLFLGLANSYADEPMESGYADTSALLMQMNIPKTVRALDIISYPFINVRVKTLTKDEYIRELLLIAQGLPLEERHIALLAAENVPHFIATKHWYMGKISYGLRNHLNTPSDQTAELGIFQTKRRQSMLEICLSLVGLIYMPLIVMYNSWRARQWGWKHPFGVGARRTEQFKTQIEHVYKGFHHYLKGNTRAWLETLALPLTNTVHMLPHERSVFIRRQARILTQATADGSSVQGWRLEELIAAIENYDVSNPKDSAAYSAVMNILLNLSVHLGDDYVVTVRSIIVSLYWIANEMVERQAVVIHKSTLETDLRVWVAL